MTAAAVKYANLEKICILAVVGDNSCYPAAAGSFFGNGGSHWLQWLYCCVFCGAMKKGSLFYHVLYRFYYGYCYYLVIGRCIIQLMRYCLPTILFMLSVNTRYWSG